MVLLVMMSPIVSAVSSDILKKTLSVNRITKMINGTKIRNKPSFRKPLLEPFVIGESYYEKD